MSPPPADAYAIAGSTRLALSPDTPAVLPSGAVVLELHDVPQTAELRLDGKPLVASRASSTVTVAVSLERSTGYHQLQVGTQRRYVFGTQDAKLRIDGVVAMLSYLREHAGPTGLAWNGTVQFSGTGQVLRDVRLDVAWLESHVAEIAEVGHAIARRPFSQAITREERARSGVPRLPATGRLVRRTPGLMERHPAGPVSFDGEQWAPRELIRARRDRTLDTPGNRAATRLLLATLELVRHCQRAAPKASQPSLRAFEHALTAVARREPFRTIRQQRGHLRLASRPAIEDRIDERYRRVRQLLQELLQERHWDPTAQVSDEWAFAGLADQVFQTFAALVVARAYDLKLLAPLGQVGPHFGSDHYAMWVDSTPPAEILSNWRDETSTPAALRPDLMLQRHADHRIALLDAKYRSAGQRATPDSLAEVQLYLQSFGCRKVGVVYPPTTKPPWTTHVISNEHFTITELPLRPSPELSDHVAVQLRPAIDELFHLASPVSRDAVTEQESETRASEVQGAAVRTLVAGGEALRLASPTAMVAPENHLRRLLPGIWEQLGQDIQRMLITAVYFGDHVPEGFDHSGPVLGLFAACERLTRDRLFGPSDAAVGGDYRRVTFGEAAEALRRLPRWRGGREQALRQWAQQQAGADLAGLERCGQAMKLVNKWRIAAAHSVLVDKATWDRTHVVVLDQNNGLLKQLDAALPNAAP